LRRLHPSLAGICRTGVTAKTAAASLRDRDLFDGGSWWFDYTDAWRKENLAEKYAEALEIAPSWVKALWEHVSIMARHIDPLSNWYDLVAFVDIHQKRKLKGDALLARTLYAMEEMLRLFYGDLAGVSLPAPSTLRDDFLGEGVRENKLRMLEYLTNMFHLNPRPRLVLMVEGESEEEQIPRLFKLMFGCSLPTVGIEIVNLRGVGNLKRCES